MNFNYLFLKNFNFSKKKGLFYERLELNNFPCDLQELSIRISSRLPLERVRLVENRTDMSRVDAANFFEEQQWVLINHMASRCDNFRDELAGCVRSRFCVSAFVVRKYQFYVYK